MLWYEYFKILLVIVIRLWLLLKVWIKYVLFLVCLVLGGIVINLSICVLCINECKIKRLELGRKFYRSVVIKKLKKY